MHQHDLLLVAALLLALIGFIHSYLGERFILGRILALPNLPELRGSRAYMENILRWAWHLTSVAWWGTVALLLCLWAGRPGAAGPVLAATFALHGLIILARVGPRHPAWPLFLLTAAAIWFGTC
jgi:hypothetical protein